jgi:glutathionyl-hydroquinone reductase
MLLTRRLLCRLPPLVSRIPPSFLTARYITNMSAEHKSEAQKDITKWASSDGHFRRQASSFRDVIEKGGKFEPEKGEFDGYFCLEGVGPDQWTGRYHIFVSYACPWAHRVLITRKLLKLDDIIGKLAWARVGICV